MKRRAQGLRTHKQAVDANQIRSFVVSAQKKLEAARSTASIATDASYELAYGAMVKGALALMFSHGVRPRAVPGHHELMIQFSEQNLPGASKGMIAVFDRMRRKRGETFYDVGVVGDAELEAALDTATTFLDLIAAEIERRHPK